MTIYGGRFKQNKKDILESKLKNYATLKNLKNICNDLPKDFPKCFKNDALIQTVNSVLLALRNKRNVIIVGSDETGLTQIAQWCADYFNKGEESYVCFCTKNLECTDLIGTQKISDSTGDENELIKFEPRFLYNAIEEGTCVVLDSINEAPSRVIERLNGLLDKKNSKKEKKFEVPENTAKAKPKIKIHEDFRIICTSNFEKINQISPAFVNRFEVIVLENQLKKLTGTKVKELIEFLCKKYQREYYNNYKKRLKKIKSAKTKKMNRDMDKIKMKP
jgi:MoxR-like ATPase